jgi:hypothetical protein
MFPEAFHELSTGINMILRTLLLQAIYRCQRTNLSA